MGELVISANNNICTLFSSQHPAKEQSLGWGLVPHANGRGEDGPGSQPASGVMGGMSLLLCVGDILPLGALLVPTPGQVLQGWI